MSQHPPDPVIITHPPGYALLRVVAAVAAALGIAAAVYYAWAGLTLSHYDAKGHLVVARRIADSLTPGWVQLGAVWLPLPHLINLVPTQVDFFYRTGAFSVGVSILSFTITAYLVARIVFETTGSALGAVAAAAVPVLNPDVLYLQSTPMTEPLLMALAAAAAFFTVRAIQDDSPARTRLAGWVVAAAFLTRYEAWPITAALVGLSLVVLLWQRRPLPVSLRRVAAIAVYPAGAALAFAVLSRATVGEWFVKSGFFVPENVAQGRPLRALVSVWWGVHELTSYPLALLAVCGVLMLVVTVCVRRDRASWVLPLALAGAAALPAYAFYNGHPFRIRYMIPLVPVVGLGLGYFVGLAGRARALAAAIALVAIVLGPRP
ncbi:MAG: glycosyltransferase family 39 protein, partial [Acidobacteria bacterium]|nr:glycosyltransferase family 39 protein [Acidobacteriota bacterium]